MILLYVCKIWKMNKKLKADGSPPFLVMTTIELIEKLREAKMRGGVRKWQILQKGIFD